ncbi:MAG: glycyl-radical enzyme activating protein [Chloroflexota bacterium]
MTGIIFDIKKFSIHDGPGIRTTVFLKGCPLKCVWCHNPEGISPHPDIHFWEQRCIACGDCAEVCPNEAVSFVEGKRVWKRDQCARCGACAEACSAEAVQLVGKTMSVPEVMTAIEKDVICYDQSGGGVTFSGGEPLAQPEFLKSLLQACKERYIHTAVDTSGLASPGHFRQILPFTDLFLFDIKLIDEKRHIRYMGVSNKLIHINLRELAQTGKNIIVRIPIIPGINADAENIRQTGEYLASLGSIHQVDILPYHHIAADKYRRMGNEYTIAEIQPPSDEQMEHIARQLSEWGFEVTMGG